MKTRVLQRFLYVKRLEEGTFWQPWIPTGCPCSILFLQSNRVKNIREEDRSAAVPSKTKPDGKKKESRRNRELLEGLLVVEVVIEPARVDLDRYRRIGEERTVHWK